MSDRVKPAALFCPHCNTEGLTILSVADDYRSVVVNCPKCRRDARLAFPPIRLPQDD